MFHLAPLSYWHDGESEVTVHNFKNTILLFSTSVSHFIPLRGRSKEDNSNIKSIRLMLASGHPRSWHLYD